MYKIRIFPSIKEENLPYFLEKIKKETLIGCIDEFGYFEFPIKLRDTSHKILDILIIGEEMFAILDFLDTKIGNHMRSVINGIGEDKFSMREEILNEDNLALNIYPKFKVSKGVVL